MQSSQAIIEGSDSMEIGYWVLINWEVSLVQFRSFLGVGSLARDDCRFQCYFLEDCPRAGTICITNLQDLGSDLHFSLSAIIGTGVNSSENFCNIATASA